MVDVSNRLDALRGLVESARSMPMSASCVVNRGEVLAAIDDVLAVLPAEVNAARGLLDDRAAVLDEARREAETVVETAIVERDRLVSDVEVFRHAVEAADRLLDSAQSDADRMRREVDDYIDGKLATFEITLSKTLAAVGHRPVQPLRESPEPCLPSARRRTSTPGRRSSWTRASSGAALGRCVAWSVRWRPPRTGASIWSGSLPAPWRLSTRGSSRSSTACSSPAWSMRRSWPSAGAASSP